MSRSSVRPSRPSQARRSVRDRSDAIDSSPTPEEAFEPQPQATPLNADALLALQRLEKGDGSATSKYLQTAFDRAAALCRISSDQVNERGDSERTRRRNRLERHKSKGTEEGDIEKQQFEDYQARIDDLNQKLEQTIRQIITDKNLSANRAKAVQHVLTKSKDSAIRRQQGRKDNNDDESAMVTEIPRLDASEHATTLLRAAQSTFETDWNSKSLTERYSQDPIYSDFYTSRWDIQHQNVNPQPPMPKASMWFAAEEGRRQPGVQSSQRGAQNASGNATQDEEMADEEADSDVEVQAENISCKCPLTLVWFQDPVSSTKCNHSFERTAIMDMLRQSKDHLPLNDEQYADLNRKYPRGARGRPQAEAQILATNPFYVLCPVCSAQLTVDDLREDTTLLRRTKRTRAAQEAAEARDLSDESDESEDDYLSKTQRNNRRKREVVNINSSPATARRQTMLKTESGVNSSHASPLGRGQSTRSGGVQMTEDDEEEEGDDIDDTDEMSE